MFLQLSVLQLGLACVLTFILVLSICNKLLAKPLSCSFTVGGNAACIVDEGTDIDDAVKQIIHGAYYQSGQSCISVQRIYVHSSTLSLGVVCKGRGFNVMH